MVLRLWRLERTTKGYGRIIVRTPSHDCIAEDLAAFDLEPLGRLQLANGLGFA